MTATGLTSKALETTLPTAKDSSLLRSKIKCTIVHKSQKVGTTQMFISIITDKHNVVHTYNEHYSA